MIDLLKSWCSPRLSLWTICYVVWVGNFLAREQESGTGLNCVMTGHDAVESMRQDNVCTVLNAIKPIWPGDLPHLCSHLLASYAPVNHRETNVSSIFVCYDSSLTHGQLPASFWGVCLWPLHSLYMAWRYLNWEKTLLYLQKHFFLFLSKRCWMVFFSCAPSDVKDKDRLPHCISGHLTIPSTLLCQIRLNQENGKEKPCFYKMLIPWGVTDGTVVITFITIVPLLLKHPITETEIYQTDHKLVRCLSHYHNAYE